MNRLAPIPVLCACLLAAPAVRAGEPGADQADPHAHCKEMAAAAEKAPAAPGTATEVKVVDAPLLDQDGRALHFKSDVLGDRLVVMNFIYTTCTTVCPILSAKFTRLQRTLGDRVGREVFLVSVSIDPTRDTPPRLKAYAAKHKAGPGWIHLTGRKDDVDELLKGLGAYTANFVEHAPMLLIGDGRTGRWARLNGFPTPEQVISQIDDLLASRRQAARE